MIDLSLLRDIVAIASFIIALGYYIINIRHQRQTRQAQLFNSIYQVLHDETFFELPWILQNDIQYTNYDDFMQKYGFEANRELYLKFHRLLTYYEGIGVYVKHGLVSPEIIDDMMSGDIVSIWDKYEPWIMEFRVRMDAPSAYEQFEYLYNKIKPIRDKQHPELTT